MKWDKKKNLILLDKFTTIFCVELSDFFFNVLNEYINCINFITYITYFFFFVV